MFSSLFNIKMAAQKLPILISFLLMHTDMTIVMIQSNKIVLEFLANPIHVTYKKCANQLFMLLVRLLVKGRLLVIKFGGSQKLHMDFQLCMMGGWCP